MSDNNSTVASMCSPAIVYLCFSLIQIIVDIYKKQFNTAFFKFWVMIIVTTMLNILCERGMGVVSWLIVFIPFILMTLLILVLIYFIGFRPGQPNKLFNNDPQSANENITLEQMRQNNLQMEQQLIQMQQINSQTTNLSQNTPNNTLEISPPVESKNPRAVASRGAKPSNGQNVPADKLTTREYTIEGKSSDPSEEWDVKNQVWKTNETVEEAFGNSNTTSNKNKLNSLAYDNFFLY